MAEESIRRLLRVFGIAATDCEDALDGLEQALGSPDASGPAAKSALEAYGRAIRELDTRWAEVSRVILSFHLRAQQALEAHLGTRTTG